MTENGREGKVESVFCYDAGFRDTHWLRSSLALQSSGSGLMTIQPSQELTLGLEIVTLAREF